MIIFTCGGTGGHISPAINLAKNINSDYLFIGGNRLEKQMLADYPFLEITTSRNNPFLILKGLWQALRILKTKKPRAVFSTGGYVTVPVGLAAVLLKIPLILLEENSIPGKTNLFLAKFATLIFTGFPNANKYFKAAKTIYSGNPYMPNTTKKIRNKIIVTGGSQGAQQLNLLVFYALSYIQELGLEIIWLTGKKNYPEIATLLKPYYQSDNTYLFNKIKITLFDFLEDVPKILPEVKLAVSRAGAMSIAELTGYKVPALYIPYPFAAENHQYYNALHIQENQAGLLLNETEANPEIIGAAIMKLSNDYNRYSAQLEVLNKTQAIAIISQELKQRGYI